MIENKSQNFLKKKAKYILKKIQMARVTKVTKGGRNISFRATIAVARVKNDKNGRMVGLGIGKAINSKLAITRAIRAAKKNLIYVPLSLNKSVLNYIHYKFGAVSVIIYPALYETGIIAGGSIRSILELSGIKNVFAKQYGANSPINNAKATILALAKINEKAKIRNFAF